MSHPDVEAAYALSPAQEGMLFHSVFDPDGGFYVTQFVCVLRDADITALEGAWQETVGRHGVFRTAFAWKGVNKTLQVVGRQAKLPIVHEDWRGRPSGGRETALDRWLDADRRRGFDLSRAPLMRLAFLRTGEAEWTLIWSHHHLLLDGWSLPRVLDEVGRRYAALLGGPAFTMAAPRPYQDYVAWLQRQDLAEAEAFWRHLLRDFKGGALPASEAPGAGGNVEGRVREKWGELSATLTVGETDALQRACREERLTLNTLVQGMWALVLASAAGKGDVIYGVTVSGRPAALPGVEEMIGLFINTLPMRARLEPAARLAAWMVRLQESSIEMRRFEHTPLVLINGWSGAPTGQPLFETIFVFENYPLGDQGGASSSGLKISESRAVEKTNYPLTLVVAPGQCLALRLSFDPERHRSQSATALIDRLVGLMRQVPDILHRCVGEIATLIEAERSCLVRFGSGREVVWARSPFTHELFDGAAAAYPQACAVECDGRSVSFSELRRRADHLADRLRTLGVGPGGRVGIFLERSLEMVVGLLAVLKSGGSYVPLDPGFPEERIDFMLDDARPKVVLTQASLATAACMAGQGRTLLVFDAPSEQWLLRGSTIATVAGTADARDEGAALHASDPAYVLFTSGSTGRPKGVVVSHGALSNLLLSFEESPGMRAGQCLLAVTTLSFDIAGLEIFLPLIVGGRLVLATRDAATDGHGLALAIAERNVDILQATPATWRLLVAADWRPQRRCQAWCGGEALPTDLASELVARGCELWNVYGPTETTIWSLTQPVKGAADARSIGRPIANTTVRILDEAGNLAPLATPGELCIGGHGVAEFYLGQPALTAEKFVPDPLSPLPGSRMYRTGDQARWNEDGTVEFLGRDDQQVKIRGFRIELGEIESALRRHPAVAEAAVIAREDMPGQKRLVGYLVFREGSTDEPQWPVWLKGILPDYMIPAAFVRMDRLPLTPNRKLDRRALPAPGGKSSSEDFIAPRTDDERKLAAIWKEVLSVQRVGAGDNFFHLGGHSLSAMQVMARIRKEWRIDLPVRRLFETAGLEELAAAIAAEKKGPAEKPIPRADRTAKPPLSFGQERIWFLEQLAPGGGAYHMPAALRLKGTLDVAALERALAELIRRHEVLRTAFSSESGRPFQLIRPEGPFPCVLLSGTSEENLRATLEAESARPFDIENGPLMRAVLVRQAPTEHALLVVAHHLVADGWSVGVMVRELAALYSAFGAGNASPLVEPPLQFVDFAVWQRAWLEGASRQVQLSFWKGRLSSETPPLGLPEDFARPAALSGRGATAAFSLSPSDAAPLREVAAQHGASLFMVLLAGFAGFLRRYSGQTDIVIGSPVANRSRPEFESMAGLFVNTVALRLDLSGEPNFGELVDQAREIALNAFAHQDVPFESVVDAVTVGRDLSRSPLFQAMLVLQNAPPAAPALEGLEVSAIELGNRSAKLDLTLTLVEVGGGLEASWEYSTDLFRPETLARWSANFSRFLSTAAAEPSARVASLPLAGDDERQLIGAWNSTDVCFEDLGYVHERFVRLAAQAPDAVALRFEGRTMTRGELSRRTETVARHLRARGAGPETLVGVCLERSFDMIVALVGILRSGAAYVPIDPEYPPGRIEAMMADSGVEVVVIQERFEHLLGSFSGTIVAVDRDWSLVEAEQAEGALPAVVAPEQAAYAIFTSGSTGRPKGAVNTHAGMRNRLEWMQAAYRLGDSDRVIQKTPFSFDVSVWEFFWPLMVGVPLVIARPGGHRDGAYLAGLICDEGVTTAHFVPSMLQAFLEEDTAAECRCLRRIICSGEALSGALRDRCFARLGAELHNLYGPTEASVDVTHHACVRGEPDRNVLIGRPIANIQIHIAEAVGIADELLIAGIGVARGYIGRPDLTAERFVPDPYSSEPGARLYRTGDLARWQSNGEIEYLGRLDRQVKIRGFRIELGEIEGALAAHPAVRHAVVDARPDYSGGSRLAAWVELRPGAASTQDSLRGWVAGRLPTYMVPDAVGVVPALPLLSSGKLDRRSLPQPVWAGPSRSAARVPPRGPVEEMLAESWREVLGLKDVGIRDNFFELGGHSLLATRLLARIRRSFGIDLPLRALFEAPTIEELGSRVAAMRAGALEVPGRQLAARPAKALIPLSFSQERLWFLERLAPGRSTYHMSAVLRLRGRLNGAALQGAFRELGIRHEGLRTSFRVVGEQAVQVVHPPSEAPSLQTRSVGTERAEEITSEIHRPFDLVSGPPVRALLLESSPDEHHLVIVLHHLIADGWSVEVIVREWTELYAAATTNRLPVLPALPLHFADYATWQRGPQQGQKLSERMEYWRSHLGDPPVLALPEDKPRPPVWDGAGGQESFHLGIETLEGLRDVGREQGATLFMTVLATFFIFLHRQTGQDDLVVGTPVANRRLAETEAMVGFFVNTLALRGRLSAGERFGDFLARMRRDCLDAFTHEETPFEAVVEAVSARRDMSRTPIYQAMLVLEQGSAPGLELPGIEIVAEPVESLGAKCELTLHLRESSGGLECVWEYSASLFDRATVRCWSEDFARVAESIARRAAIGADKESLRADWQGRVTAADNTTLLARISEWTRRYPDALAVEDEACGLTYGDLSRRSARVARRLRGMGVGAETVVAVCLERSADWIVALLAILRAGGAYLPLDPRLPAGRLAWMASDARALRVLTSPELAGNFSPHGPPVQDFAELERAEPDAPSEIDEAVDEDQLAYVIYTSGSTGQPKGVMVSHGNLLNLVDWHCRAFQITERDVATQLAGLGFDAAGWEVWPYLASGAAIVMPPAAAVAAPEVLRDFLIARAVTVSFLPTPLAEACLGIGWPAQVPLRLLLTGGDRLHRPPPPGLPFTLINNYGPTESTVVASSGVSEPDPEGRPPPIGRLVDNTRGMVLDAALDLLPRGARGQLSLGGRSLARGYLNRPDLTADRFRPDPFSPVAGARLYLTGDHVRFLHDGQIEFFERLDQQVKIRGVRIELGEIEAVLGREPGVGSSVVIAKRLTTGDLRLVGYVVAEPGIAVQPGSLRAHLREKLPEVMVPSAFVILSELPLNSNGKVDRRALPDPAEEEWGQSRLFVEPRAGLEMRIAAAWAAVLARNRIGSRDNFFDLGGHSLLILKLQAALQLELGRDVPVVDLFAYPTVASFAEHWDGTAPAMHPPGGAAVDRAERQRAAQELRRSARQPKRP